MTVIADRRRGRPSFGWDALTERQSRVIELVAAGLTNREIGRRLNISRYTVDAHLRNILIKLGISSRVSLTRAYVQRLAGVGE